MNILSLDIYKGKYQNFLEFIKTPNKRTTIFTPNPELLMKAHHDDEFYLMLKGADYLLPDANGLYTASLITEGKSTLEAIFMTLFARKKLEEKYGELIPGSTLTKDIVLYASEKGIPILFIDNYRITEPENDFEVRKMQIQKNLPTLFRQRFPTLNVEVIFEGEKSPDALATLILEKNIRYVFSCIGMKIQEKRLVEIFAHIPEQTQVIGLAVGSSFDYLLGLQKRAPDFFQKYGLEWLYRFMLDPIGRWKRIKTALIDFPKLVANKQ